MAKKTKVAAPVTEAKPQKPVGTPPSARAAKPAAATKAVEKPTRGAGKAKPIRTSEEKQPAETKVANGHAPTNHREKIALRAYFIAERRRAQGEHREPSEDWLEAERELAAEARRSR